MAERDHIAALQQQINTLQLEIIGMEGHLEGEQKRMSQKSRRSLDKLYTSKYSNTTPSDKQVIVICRHLESNLLQGLISCISVY